MDLKFQVGQEVLVKVIIKEIRITKDGVGYEVMPTNLHTFSSIPVLEEDIVKETREDV